MTNKCLLCALLLTGCASKPAPSPAPPSGPFHLVWQMKTAPRSLDTVPVTVRVTDKAGQPVSGARVSVNLSMPFMSMPENKVALQGTQPGMYAGTVRYSMFGAWTATVTVTKNGQRSVKTFPVAVQ